MTYQATGYPPFINVGLSIEEWNSYVATYNFGQISPSRIVLHHTWKPTVDDWRGVASMKGMQNYYRGLGWSAAPHLYVAPDKIWLATPMSEVGIHAGSGNSGTWNGKWSYSIGIELVGNYDSQRPSGLLWEQAKAVMGELSKRLGIAPPQLIYFHRDFSTKSCPGWAITKEWVFGEIEAYINNAKPPKPPAIGVVGTPTPDQEVLLEGLLTKSYEQRAEGYSSEWAFHQYAVKNGTGMPLAKSARVAADGKEYNFQPFARDTLYCEVPQWGDVKLLSELLGGAVPPSGVGRVLLEETYKACGATFHADWAFHQYAMKATLGPPIGESGKIQVGGKEYAYQTFALDTLFNEVPKWSDVQQLSQISDAALRDALLTATYKSAGATYHSDWAFHRMATKLHIGSPLSNSFQASIGGAQYAMQVYTLDTLYNLVPNWSAVKRLGDLAKEKGMPNFTSAASFGTDDQWKPPYAYRVVQYTPTSPACETREGAPISMVFVHGDSFDAESSLQAIANLEARWSCHYYIAVDGTIHQLVPEHMAAWHSGMFTFGSLWANTNRISIGVVLEGMPDALHPIPPSAQSGRGRRRTMKEIDVSQQIEALRWLLRDIVQRYHLTPDDVVLASSLVTSLENIPHELLVTDVFE